MKKMFICLIAAFSAALGITASAYTFPNAYWSAATGYGNALNNQDDQQIITYGKKIIDILANEPTCTEVTDNRAAKSYEVAKAYERLGDYTSAAYWFDWCIPYNEAMGWDDAVTAAELKVNFFTPRLDTYTLTDEPQVNFGARNEPAKGVLYGQVSENNMDGESADLLYISYGDAQESFSSWNKSVLKKDSEAGRAVEIALNFDGNSSQLESILSDTEYQSQLMQFLKSYPNIPIYLRIGAEMNIWDPIPDAELFKQAFIKVASEARTLSNVAIVWSVSHTSQWGVDFADYYPGDEYVDWVGASIYCNKYFGGQTWSGNSLINEFYFKSGLCADPVFLTEELVQKFGDRKPVMVAECGSAYVTLGSVQDRDDYWANVHMRGMYNYIPMVFPQVKFMAYFNKQMAPEQQYYDLSGCEAIAGTYENVTKSPWFIQDSYQNTAKTFKKAQDTVSSENGKLELYTYAHVYGNNEPTVEYIIDGASVLTSDMIPYKCEIDLSGYSEGTHALTVAVNNGGTRVTSKDYTLNVSYAENLDDLTQNQRLAIEYNLNSGIMTGYEDGTIRPYSNITRAEFATMVCRANGYDASGKCSFADAADHWASPYIKACVDHGAINGVGENNFAPSENVTFAQSAKIMTITRGFTTEASANSKGGYPDGYILVGLLKGLFKDVSLFDNDRQITRMDAAMMFYNSK